jgi:predicted nuclease with TOPRIM domain
MGHARTGVSFTIDDFHDLIRILEQQPEWRAELRRVLLSEELLALPGLMRQLIEVQQRAEERLAGIEDRLAGVEGRLEGVEDRLGRIEQNFATMTEVVQKLGVDVGNLKGQMTELRYERRAPAYFSRIIRRVHALTGDELTGLIEDARERGAITDDEADNLLLADVIVRGRARDDGREVYLVVEASWGVGIDDVRRAAERAALLTKAGVETVPVVAGDWLAPGVTEYAEAARVWQVTDGHVVAPPAS